MSKIRTGEGIVKITVEIEPGREKTRIKPFRKVIEFPVKHADLPLRISAYSAKDISEKGKMAEQMCED